MSAQLEDGFTMIANELLEEIPRFKFNGTQFRLVIAVWRFTYGFKRKDHEMSIKFFVGATGLGKTQIDRELKTLIEKKVLVVTQESTYTTSRKLGFNKNYQEWEIEYSQQESGQSAKTLTVSENVSRVSAKTLTGGVSKNADQEIKGFKEINKATTRESQIQILNLYCFLHNKLDLNVSATDRSKMMELAESEVPLEFILESMKKIFEARGDNIRGFGYYPPFIKDAWTNSLTPIVSQQQKKNTNKINDILGRFLESDEN